jgi:DNA adenine methylase
MKEGNSTYGTYSPLFKYTGGKFKEYDDFKNHIPDKINNYYEPFFGGGGVFFRLMNDKKISGVSFGNDISEDLILFYNNVTNKKMIKQLKALSNTWDAMTGISNNLYFRIGYDFHSIIIGDREDEGQEYDDVLRIVSDILDKRKKSILIDTHEYSLPEYISTEIISKKKKFLKKNLDKTVETLEVTENCIKTATRQAFYFLIRRMYNDILLGSTNYTVEERCSYWYFLREMGFGGMFRFSSNGEFNIPYGGISYNNKCLKCKIDRIASEKTREVFDKISFTTKDFRDFMSREYDENDFMFLDPPYDSEFSEYDRHPFGKKEHTALRDILKNIDCKWLLIIRKTPLIEELYKDFKKEEFDKKYMFQARGTYEEKNSIHLIIKNF